MNSYRFTAPVGRSYLIWITLGLVLGISFGLTFPMASDSSLVLRFALGLSAGLLVSILTLVSLEKGLQRHLPDLLLFWFVLIAFFLGIFRVYIFDSVQNRSLRNSTGVSQNYTGILAGNPTLSSTGKSYGFPVKVLSLKTEDDNQPVSGTMMLYAPAKLSRDLARGDAISFTATLNPPAGASYLGGFSTREYLYRQNYLFQEYTETLSKINLSYEFGIFDRIKFLGETIRNSILRSIDQSFGEQSTESALLKGILLGVREDFSSEQYQEFIDSGLVHITSVSGMHVVFLSNFFFFLFQKLRLPKRLISLILIPVLFLFTSVAAFTTSVCRSTMMMLLFFLAQLLQREPDALTSLATSALVLLLINPYNLTSYSFLLSFSSTLGIILFAGPLQCYLLKPFRPKPRGRKSVAPKPLWRRFLVEPICSSLSMTAGCLLGMGYFGMRFFRRITWGSFLANLCLLPFSSATFLLGLLNWPLSYLCPGLSKMIAQIPLTLMLWCINQIASIFSHPIFRIVTPTPPNSFLLPYLVFCIALYFTIKPREKNNT